MNRDETARRVWQLMTELVTDRDRRARVSAEMEMSFGRVRALRQIRRSPSTMRELAAALSADPPYVTLMVDDLEERGFVARRPHPDDRRAKLVELTEAGREACELSDRILFEPPPGIGDARKADLEAMLELLQQAADRRDQATGQSEG